MTMTFRDWLVEHGACEKALEWVDQQPHRSPEALWRSCTRGDWMLWCHAQADTPAETLAPVAFAAADRACRKYLPHVLEAAGLPEAARSMRQLPPIVDTASAREARIEAEAAAQAAAARRVAEALEALRVAEAASRAVALAEEPAVPWAAALAAAQAAEAPQAEEGEHRRCADHCRRVLSCPR